MSYLGGGGVVEGGGGRMEGMGFRMRVCASKVSVRWVWRGVEGEGRRREGERGYAARVMGSTPLLKSP